ncbi:hypothetical protein DMENIID0001_131660 [Sergentomyia squamirostris]
MITKYDSTTKIWYNDKVTKRVFDEHMGLGQTLLYLLSLCPENVCQISYDDDSRRTNGEIMDATLVIAYNLTKFGCKQGNVITYVCNNSHDLTPAILAGFLLGTPINVIDPGFPKDDILRMFQLVEPYVVFCDDNMADMVESLLKKLGSDAHIFTLGLKIPGFTHIGVLMDDNGDENGVEKLSQNPPEVDGNSCAAIVWSSGTTGLAKGVAVSHKRLMTGTIDANIKRSLNPGDNLISFKTLFLTSALNSLIFGISHCVPRILTRTQFSPQLFMDLYHKYKIGVFFSTPHITTQLINSGLLSHGMLDNIKYYVTTGAPMTAYLESKMFEYLRNGIIYNIYGLTECGGIALNIRPTSVRTVGQLVPGVQAKIIDNCGDQLGVNETGELCVKTESFFLNYWKKPEDIKQSLDGDGWFHTGDLGYFNHEGNLIILGRSRDVLNHEGGHIYPAEMEEILQKHPAIEDIAIVGIPDPDRTHHIIPTAVVVKSAVSEVTEQELATVIQWKVRLCGGVYFIQMMPRTVSGKIQRCKLKDMVVNLGKKNKY